MGPAGVGAVRDRRPQPHPVELHLAGATVNRLVLRRAGAERADVTVSVADRLARDPLTGKVRRFIPLVETGAGAT